MTSVKFQKNRNKTVGGVAHTRYILLLGEGRTDGQTDEMMKAKNHVPPFSSKRRGTKNSVCFQQYKALSPTTLKMKVV